MSGTPFVEGQEMYKQFFPSCVHEWKRSQELSFYATRGAKRLEGHLFYY